MEASALMRTKHPSNDGAAEYNGLVSDKLKLHFNYNDLPVVTSEGNLKRVL